MLQSCSPVMLLHYGTTVLRFAVEGDDPKRTVEVFSRKNHALAFDTANLSGWEVCDEANLLAYKVFGLVVFCDTAHDSAAAHAVVDFELKQFVGLLHL